MGISCLLLIIANVYANELLFVMEFATEGVHTPDIVLDETLTPNMLLPEGAKSHRMLGELIREEYGGLIEDKYALFQFASYNEPYAIDSLKAQLEGIFQSDVHNGEIKVETSAEEVCPRIALLMTREIMKKKPHLDLMQDLEPFKDQVSNYLGKEDVDMMDYFELGEAIKISIELKHTLPSSISPAAIDLLLNFHEHYQEFLSTGHKEQIKLLSHQGLTQMIDSIADAMKKEKRKQRTRFVVHLVNEITFIAVLKMLNLYTSHPPLASTLFIELYKRYNDFYIRMRYNGQPLTLPVGGTEMTFKRFKTMVKKRKFENEAEWTATCYSEEDKKSYYWVRYFGSLAIFIVVTAGGVLLYRFCQKDKEKDQ